MRDPCSTCCVSTPSTLRSTRRRCARRSGSRVAACSSRTPRALATALPTPAGLEGHWPTSGAVLGPVERVRRSSAAGDPYEPPASPPVAQPVYPARRAPPPRPRHFVLVSAFGARPGGGYLGWKHKAEEAVRASGLPHTILRPSFLDSRGSGSVPSDGVERKPPPALGPALRLLGEVPLLRGVSDDLRPIPVTVLCAAIARILDDRAPLGILSGRQIWPLGAMPRAAAAAGRCPPASSAPTASCERRAGAAPPRATASRTPSSPRN